MGTRRRAAKRNTESVETVVMRLWERATLRAPEQIAEGVWCVGELGEGGYLPGFPLGTGAAAVEAMETLPGFMIATPSGLTLVEGRRGTTANIFERRRLEDITVSRETWEKITGSPCPWWSIPKIARKLLEWAAAPESPDDSDEQTNPPGYWHHQECTVPGVHDECVMYDVSGYYYNLLRRLPSPRVRNTAGRIWTTDFLQGEERERWGRMLREIAPAKALRNTLVGCMAGSRDTFDCYSSRGGTVPVYCYPSNKSFGPFRAAGLLVVETGRELTAKQCLTAGAIYGNIDCAVLPVDNPLTPVWTKYALPVSVKAKGDAEICHVGSWRVGRQATVPYKQGRREYQSREREPDPGYRLAEQWLTPEPCW